MMEKIVKLIFLNFVFGALLRLTVWSSLYTMKVADSCKVIKELEMWSNAQRDGHPAQYRWRPLFNAAVWLTPTTRVPCSYSAKT